MKKKISEVSANKGKVTFCLFPLEGEGGRRPDEGESKTRTSFINLTGSPLTCPTGHPLPQGRGGTTHGFTLIELLVVVLIIGILAAVAVPQYQKAVEKSRATEAMTLLNAVYQAAKSYQLANGTWPTQFAQLDVDVPWTGSTPFVQNEQMTDTRANEDWSIQLYFGSNTHNGLWIGRLKGNYERAGFAMLNSYGNTEVDIDRIVCVEEVENFEKEDGAYCQKLLNGTLLRTDRYRYYHLPF